MATWELRVLDVFFLVFHTALVLFNMTGWAWKKTRRWHLITMTLTSLSWFVMGLRYGVGYCICTDWHWQIRRALGIHDQDSTYIQFLVRVLTGWRPDDGLVRSVTGAAFSAVLILTVGLNLRDRRTSRTSSSAQSSSGPG